MDILPACIHISMHTESQLQVDVSYQVGAGNQTQLLQEQHMLQATEPAPSPEFNNLKSNKY